VRTAHGISGALDGPGERFGVFVGLVADEEAGDIDYQRLGRISMAGAGFLDGLHARFGGLT
jgi:hypothetical protein